MDQIKLLAQVPKSLGNELKGIGPLGGEGVPLTNEITAVGMFVTTLSLIIGVLTIVAILWFVFVLFTGAISWLAASGDKAKLQTAQKRIIDGIVGLILVISAIFIIQIIGTMAGIPNILNVSDLILTKLKIGS